MGRLAYRLGTLAVLAIGFSVSGANAQEREWVHSGIRPQVFQAALTAYRAHRSEIANKRYLTIVDYGLPSNRPRLFVLDYETGTVTSYLVAHGKGSDPDHTGRAQAFSNRPGSEMSSIGAYLTGPTYIGSHGESLRLYGLDPTNDKAADRAIVLHGAKYVAPGLNVLGRSWGCPAVEQRFAKAIINKIRQGSLLFVHS